MGNRDNRGVLGGVEREREREGHTTERAVSSVFLSRDFSFLLLFFLFW